MATAAHQVWRPSASRVLLLDGFVTGPRGFPPAVPDSLKWPAKDPADVLDYQLDIGPALYGNDGDKIATLDVVIVPADAGGLSVLSTAADGCRAVLWLQGGNSGIDYVVTLSIGTEAGRLLSRSILLPVRAFTSAAFSSLPLVLEDGSTLVDDSGTPLTLSPAAAS